MNDWIQKWTNEKQNVKANDAFQEKIMLYWHCQSSDPHVHPLDTHHWASLGFHFAGLNPISLVGLSRWPGEGRYPQHINWSLVFLRGQFLDPFSSLLALHHWVPLYKYMASPTLLCWWQPDDLAVAARISGCLADISAWMKEHHLQINLAKTELLVFPATPALQHDFTRFFYTYPINFRSEILV